ncbi:hypothetical protein K458DRAFT_151369 [Lentithecium fluviatile CBS 122367]|uniref:Zn(2)-C6 fungal-type domain-containing protein n=1 Tax=Lentithecium fluviatile CBS 122367 TaxID=1168545 RepID=A0A6G1JEY4_9PLEO|nr:hypothetical protein K458DRAFT_151369 [Lentithecium fluviatile CBS 122367]
MMARTGAAARVDPACGTCRKKCRKCDRGRPHCTRCVSKGLVCEGYPLSVKMYNVRSASSHHEQPNSKDLQKKPSSEAVLSSKLLADVQPSDSVQVQMLLAHYETVICTVLPSSSSQVPNPFKAYILPLAYQNAGLLEAVLGLSACHLRNQDSRANSPMIAAAIEHRLSAFQALSTLLRKEEDVGLNDTEEEIALALVLTLVIHDICDCGRSKYGAHLNGVAFLCSRIATRVEPQSPVKIFLVTALTWFDLLRGYSGAEKLAFPFDTRKFVELEGYLVLQTLIGCPSDIFSMIGQALSTGRKFKLHEIDVETCHDLLDPLLVQLRAWDLNQTSYPDDDIEWRLLAEAYRQTAILRILRLPDTYLIPCSDDRIRACVATILDASAQVPRGSTYFKRFLFPLFVAGAETESPHQQQYVSICVDHIRKTTGFKYQGLEKLLQITWDERKKSDGTVNVPWFDYTCSADLTRQHDYLFF